MTTKEIESILEPIFRSTVESLGLKIPLDSENLQRDDLLKVLKGYDTRKVFRITADLIDTGEIGKIVAEQQGGEIAVDEMNAKIKVFVDSKLVLPIETPETKFQLSPTFKLLITPLGISFLYCFRRGLFIGKNLDESISSAERLLGSIHEDFVENGVRKSLLETQAALNKKEIAISLLLLLSQALNPDRSLKISKAQRQAFLSRLTKSLNRIGEKVFDESELFRDAQDTDNAIRRSTGVSGLEGKMSGLYSKRSSGDRDILYFEYKNDKELISIVSRVCDSIKEEEKNKNGTCGKNVIELIDRHIRDRNSLFPPWIRRKFLDRNAETVYLQKLMGIFKRNLS